MKILSFEDQEAKKIVEEGYVLALPTETVYGVGVRFDDETAYERLCKSKNRRPDKAIAVMCSPSFPLDEYFEISDGAKRVMDHFLKTKDKAPYQTHLGTGIAGIRIPAKKDLLLFLSSLPFAMQVTSANMSGEPATAEFSKTYNTFNNIEEVKGIIKGECQSGVPTTVVDLTKDSPIIIRQGDITKEEIEKVFYNIK